MDWYDLAWLLAFGLAFWGLWMTWVTLQSQRNGTAGQTWFSKQLTNMSAFFVVGDQVPVGRSYLARLEQSDDQKNDGLATVPKNVETVMKIIVDGEKVQTDTNLQVNQIAERVARQDIDIEMIMAAQQRVLEICNNLDNMMGGRRK